MNYSLANWITRSGRKPWENKLSTVFQPSKTKPDLAEPIIRPAAPKPDGTSTLSSRKERGWGVGTRRVGGWGWGGDEEPALQTQPQTCIEILWEAARFAPSLQWSAWCRMTPSGWLIPPPPPPPPIPTPSTHTHTRTHSGNLCPRLPQHPPPPPPTPPSPPFPLPASAFFSSAPSTVQLFKTAQQNLTQQRGSSKLPVLQWGIPPFCHCLGPARSVLCRHFTERKKKEEEKKGGGGGGGAFHWSI